VGGEPTPLGKSDAKDDAEAARAERQEQIRSRAEHCQSPHQPSTGGGQNHADHRRRSTGRGAPERSSSCRAVERPGCGGNASAAGPPKPIRPNAATRGTHARRHLEAHRRVDTANHATAAASSSAPRRPARRAAQPRAGPRHQKPKLPCAASPGSGKGRSRRRPRRAGFARRRTPATAVGKAVEAGLLPAARVSTRVARGERRGVSIKFRVQFRCYH
jgi:hypothetical protein